MRIVWLSFIFLFFFSRFQYGYAQIQNIREKQDSVSISNSTQHLGEKPTQMGKPSMMKMIYTMLTNKAVGE